MGQSKAIGPKALEASPIKQERTKKYLGLAFVTLIALAALAGAIYGGISLASHSFTLFGETGTLALTIVSGVVILGLCTGGTILYRKSKQNAAPSSGNDSRTFTNGSSRTEGTKATNSPYELKPRDAYRHYKRLSLYLTDYEYLCETGSQFNNTYYFSDCEISRRNGVVRGTANGSGREANSVYELEGTLKGKTQVTFDTLERRAKHTYENPQMASIYRIQAQHILYKPLSIDPRKLLPQLHLPPTHFSYVITEHAPFDGASKETVLHIINKDATGKITSLQFGSNAYTEEFIFSDVCHHINKLEQAGLAFMPQKELIAQSNLK